MSEDKLKLMRQMTDRLNEAADAYYNGRQELMTDYEWDALFDELKKLEEETGTVLEDSPTMNVSADQIAGAKEPHEFAALSLAKTKKPEDLVKWAEGRKIWLSWKLDGLTLVVTYDNGRLRKVVTRGDGHIGTNITHLASAIQGILAKIDYPGHLVIRGEAVISYEDFDKFRMESGEDYANPRNLASGSLSLKDVNEVKKREIHWLPFTLVHSDEEIVSWGDQMAFLEKLGFVCVEHESVDSPDLASVQQAIDGWTKKVTDGKNPYPVDGLVICYDDTVYAQSGSVTGHHATRAGYAFKWQDEAAESVLQYIEWSCAASTITPVAVFEPVELEGTTVKRASLCNISECERLGIGDEGTKIAVSEASGNRTLRCTNPECPAKQLKKFARFVSKAGMDIDGISEATLSRFVNEGWISRYGDIYRLREHAVEIAQLDGFGEKSSANLMASLDKASAVSDQKLLFALNIPLVGADVAKKLLGRYPLSELIRIAAESEDETVFSAIDGIGPEKSRAFVSWIRDERNRRDLEDLLTEVKVEASEVKASGNRCDQLTFVVTGDVHHYPNRNALKAYIESQGGKVTGSVSRSTDFLINNDPASTSSKNTKARSLGIAIISEDEFLERFVN